MRLLLCSVVNTGIARLICAAFTSPAVHNEWYDSFSFKNAAVSAGRKVVIKVKQLTHEGSAIFRVKYSSLLAGP